MKTTTQHKDRQSTPRSGQHQPKRASPSTSFVEGVGPSTPPVAGSSKSDSAKALAAAQPNIPCQRRSHAAQTLPPGKGSITGFGSGEAAQECGRLCGPSATDFCAKDDQTCPAVLSGQFRVSPRSGNVQSLSIDRGCPCTSSAVASNWGDHGDVNGQLRAVPQRQAINHWRSMSRTRTFTRTRPPASRHTRAATFSKTQPRRTKTIAVPHAARWWPRTSRGGPHRQERADKGKGNLRRRRSRMQKG